jgi:hypothetical protein
MSRSYCVPGKERRVPIAIITALPFVLVRLVYSACSVFLHDHLFNIVTGNVVVLVVMAVLEEFVVVVIYIALGFVVDKLDKSDPSTIAGRQWKVKKGRHDRRRERHTGSERGAQRSGAQEYMDPEQPLSVHQHGIVR